MTEEEAIGFLDKGYQQLGVQGEDRCQILATVIALKQAEEGLADYQQPIYVDAKQCIRFFFEDLTDKDFGYDEFSLQNFSPLIDRFPNDQALNLYLYIRHLCNLREFETSDLDEKIEALRIESWKRKGEYLRVWLYLIANRSSWIVSVTLLYLAFVMLFFLPAPAEWMELIKVDGFKWVCDSTWEEFSTYLSTILFYIFHGETETPVVTPLNLGGVLLIGLLEFCFWGLIVNFLYQRILNYLQSAGLSENP